MSAPKLQRLCYYAQAWSLVWDGAPLYAESVRAWRDGPAIRVLFQAHRGRFEIEARHAAALHHPGVAAVFDVGEAAATDGSGHPRPFLVMELVNGQPLSTLLQDARNEGRQLDPGVVRDLMAQTGDALGAAHRVTPRVFGSLAWAALTGLDYLGPASDLDLLWPVLPPPRMAALLAALGGIETRAPMRLDGEVLLPDGSGANWREIQAGAAEILVKRAGGVALLPRADFLGTAGAA